MNNTRVRKACANDELQSGTTGQVLIYDIAREYSDPSGSSRILIPSALHAQLGDTYGFIDYTPGQQHDASEALEVLINAMTNGINSISAVSSLFGGFYQAEFKCASCGITSDDQPEPEFVRTVLSVPIVRSDTLQHAVDLICETCDVERTCPVCQHSHACMSTAWQESPEILPVVLKRFGILDGVPFKNHKSVGISEVLNVTVGDIEKKYILRSVIEHLGQDIESGHYIAYVSCEGR